MISCKHCNSIPEHSSTYNSYICKCHYSFGLLNINCTFCGNKAILDETSQFGNYICKCNNYFVVSPEGRYGIWFANLPIKDTEFYFSYNNNDVIWGFGISQLFLRKKKYAI